MNLLEYTLLALLSLPPSYSDANEVDRDARMRVIASAVSDASTKATCTESYSTPACVRIWDGTSKDLAALVLTKGWWESRYARNVHEGKCREHECDAVKLRNGDVWHMARTPWQFQRTVFSEPVWTTFVGTDYEATRQAAWVATTILSRGMRACGSVQGAIAWYGIGRCESTRLGDRYKTYVTLKGMQ